MADDRPKPQYGELAPEGWVWKPPAPPAGSDVPAPASESTGARATGGAPGYSGASHSAPPPAGAVRPYGSPGLRADGPGAGAGAPRRVNSADVVATGVLLFFGILLSASMVPALFDFTSVLGQAAAMQGYGTFTASASAQVVGTAAGVATIVLNLASVILSVRRVQRRRIAFFIPLVFGAVTFVAWIGAITYAFFSDPSFLAQITAITSTSAP